MNKNLLIGILVVGAIYYIVKNNNSNPVLPPGGDPDGVSPLPPLGDDQGDDVPGTGPVPGPVPGGINLNKVHFVV